MSKKIGAFSKVEIQYLVEHCKTDTIEEMAEALNRTEETVKKQMMERGLWLEKSGDELEYEAKIKQELYKRSWWPSIHLSCNDMELNYFENFWVDMMSDVNSEITKSEAIFIKDWGLLEIDKLRLLSGQKEARDKILELETELSNFPPQDQRDPVENIRYNQMFSELALCKGAVGEHTSNLDKINKNIDAISKKLKLDREAKRDKETTADSFWKLVAILEDEVSRNQNEQLAELMKASMMKAKSKLSENHKYIDNEIDRPILNSDTLKLDEE
jgi:hypothetical protein